MAKYTVINPVEHDGVRTEAGEKIELNAADAASLLACGAIADGKAKPADAEAPAGE